MYKRQYFGHPLGKPFVAFKEVAQIGGQAQAVVRGNDAAAVSDEERKAKFVLYRIDHMPEDVYKRQPLVRAPVNSFEFQSCDRSPQAGYLTR